jgi:hypothetical protein
MLVSVPEVLLNELRRQRDLDVDFASAWPEALAVALASACDTADWLHVFNATREGWRCGYERRRPERRETALTAIAYDELGPLEHQDVDHPERRCALCGGEIPAARSPRAMYCSRRCAERGRRPRDPAAARARLAAYRARRSAAKRIPDLAA